MLYITARHMEGGTGHEHIASVRWLLAGTQQTGVESTANMVTYVEGNPNQTYVYGPPAAHVGVYPANPKYLRTHADGAWTNNLLSLPTF